MKDGAKPFTLFGLVLIILSLDKVSFRPSESECEHSDIQISFSLPGPLIDRGEVVWTFRSLKHRTGRSHSFSFISTPGREQIASDGPDIFLSGFQSCFYAILSHSLIEDMILCPFIVLRFYLDILEILGEICASSLSR